MYILSPTPLIINNNCADSVQCIDVMTHTHTSSTHDRLFSHVPLHTQQRLQFTLVRCRLSQRLPPPPKQQHTHTQSMRTISSHTFEHDERSNKTDGGVYNFVNTPTATATSATSPGTVACVRSLALNTNLAHTHALAAGILRSKEPSSGAATCPVCLSKWHCTTDYPTRALPVGLLCVVVDVFASAKFSCFTLKLLSFQPNTHKYTQIKHTS